MSNITKLNPYEVHEFKWGTAIKHRKGKWKKCFLNGGQIIDVTDLNVTLHDNGIEFN